MNHLYYGNNLIVLRESIADESVDLIYLRGGGGDKWGMEDGRESPPFNSKRDYNLLFKSPSGRGGGARDKWRQVHGRASEAHIDEDRGGGRDKGGWWTGEWHWNQQAEREFDELLHQPNTDVADMMKALRGFLAENDLMAYLTMMANRLRELHRVLKPTGSLYVHCVPAC